MWGEVERSCGNAHRCLVPEARKILAGGGAQRNHRKHDPAGRFAPAGREKRETVSARIPTEHVSRREISRPSGAELVFGRSGPVVPLRFTTG